MCRAIIQPSTDILSPGIYGIHSGLVLPGGVLFATRHISPVLSPLLDLGSISEINNITTSAHSYQCFPM